MDQDVVADTLLAWLKSTHTIVTATWITTNLQSLALIIGGAFALQQYRNQNHWKAKEFAAAQEKEFRTEPYNSLLLGIIYWGEMKIPDEFCNDKSLTSQVVSQASFTTSINKYQSGAQLSVVEQLQLMAVDRFLESLSRLQRHMDSGLVEPDDYRLFFGYVTQLVSGEQGIARYRHKAAIPDTIVSDMITREREFQLALNAFMRFWEYEDALRFLANWRNVNPVGPRPNVLKRTVRRLRRKH